MYSIYFKCFTSFQKPTLSSYLETKAFTVIPLIFVITNNLAIMIYIHGYLWLSDARGKILWWMLILASKTHKIAIFTYSVLCWTLWFKCPSSLHSCHSVGDNVVASCNVATKCPPWPSPEGHGNMLMTFQRAHSEEINNNFLELILNSLSVDKMWFVPVNVSWWSQLVVDQLWQMCCPKLWPHVWVFSSSQRVVHTCVENTTSIALFKVTSQNSTIWKV